MFVEHLYIVGPSFMKNRDNLQPSKEQLSWTSTKSSRGMETGVNVLHCEWLGCLCWPSLWDEILCANNTYKLLTYNFHGHEGHGLPLGCWLWILSARDSQLYTVHPHTHFDWLISQPAPQGSPSAVIIHRSQPYTVTTHNQSHTLPHHHTQHAPYLYLAHTYST